MSSSFNLRLLCVTIVLDSGCTLIGTEGKKTLQEKPWFRHWPEDVPKTLEYPEIPLFSLLSQATEKWPDNIAFSLGEGRLSYRELDDITSRLAAGLADLGVEVGDKVLLFLSNSIEFVIGYYGILKAGATVTTVNPLSRQVELRHQINDTGATAIITSAEFYPVVEEVRTGTTLKTAVVTDMEKGERIESLLKIINFQVRVYHIPLIYLLKYYVYL